MGRSGVRFTDQFKAESLIRYCCFIIINVIMTIIIAQLFPAYLRLDAQSNVSFQTVTLHYLKSGQFC